MTTWSQTNRRRNRNEMEYELLDTGIFDEDRYFDVFVEYAKASPEDILVQISVCNRGPEAATLHVLPTLWFRNTWSWDTTTAEDRCSQRSRPISGDPRASYASRRIHDARRPLPLLRGTLSAAVHGERNQQRAALRHARTRRPT